MKIVLINPPATYGNWYKRPVLGLAYISACLESAGFECAILDAYFNSWSEEELLQRVRDYAPDVVGITAMTHQILKAARIASELKKQLDVPIIIGGCHVTALPERTLAEFSAFDYAVCGEGEGTTPELLRCLEAGALSGLDDLMGVAFRKGEEIVVNKPRPYLTSAELDALPFPAFHHYYGQDPHALVGKGAYYVMLASRGCPYNCAFCMRVLGKKDRRRSPENILQEMDHAIKHYGAHTFDFADEVFLFNTRETRELLEAMIERGLPDVIKWSGLVRANLVSPELIALAKKAGCNRLEMGVESGDDEILKAIRKGITVEQVRKAVKIIKESRISLGTYFILGHPNETLRTMRKTVDLAAELNTDTIAVGLMVPYPGTKIFEMASRGEGGYRLLARDWSEYDKYCSRALEVAGVPHEAMVKWQRRALMNLYLKNFRFVDGFKFFWKRRHACLFALQKRVASLVHVRGGHEDQKN
jgi:radical SAM superfamily enzyme YgiQ (UPF0313 family)